MINPIDGAVQQSNEVVYSALGTYEVGQIRERAALNGLEVSGPSERAARMSYSVGLPSQGIALVSSETGFPVLTPFRTMLEVTGEGQYKALQSYTVKGLTDDKAYAALQSMEVGRSNLYAVRHGYDVSGQAYRPVYQSYSVRRVMEYAALFGLTVRSETVQAVLSAYEVAQRLETTVYSSADIRNGETFFILADILQAELASLHEALPAGFYLAQEINARLFVNGNPVPITSFDFQDPKGKLGASLTITLAIPNRNLVPLNGDVLFEIFVTAVDGSEWAKPLVTGGKIMGRDYAIQWSDRPNDQVTISVADVKQEKFSLRPKRPVVLFDPAKHKYTDVETRPRDAIVDEKGKVIMPILEPSTGLTMISAMQRAYTNSEGIAFMSHLSPSVRATLSKVAALLGSGSNTSRGLGFSRVITNIPNYPVSRADFTIEGGWHNGVLPLIGMYGPIFFVQSNILFVLDITRRLPAGATAHVVPVSVYARLGQSNPYRDLTNGVLLTYQQTVMAEDDATILIRTRYEDSTDKAGQFGDAGYTETYTRNRIVEKFRADDPDNVIASYVEEVYAETRVGLPNIGGYGTLTLVRREKQQDTYVNDLKSGHFKTVEGLITTGPDASLELVTVLTEKCEIAWKDDVPNPGGSIQTRNHTVINGLVYESTDTVSRMNLMTGQKEDVNAAYPALVAQSNGIVEDDGRMYFGPIKTITETLRTTTANVQDVEIVEVDLLTGTIKRDHTQPRTGSRFVNQYETRAKTVLIVDADSIAEIGERVPHAVNAGELPEKMAMDLGRRVLKHIISPPEDIRMGLPGVSFAIEKGSVVAGRKRDDSLTPSCIVEGVGISGVDLGQAGRHRISMSLECVELTT